MSETHETSANGSNGTTTALARPAKPVSMTTRGIVLSDIDGLWRFATMVAKSGMAPKGMGEPAICVAIQMGLEVGLSPMQALQSTAVINGRPAIYGDAAKALVESSGLMEDYDQWFECDGKKLTTQGGLSRMPSAAELKNKTLTCCVMSKRKSRKPLVATFSVEDATAASLWGKPGPWSQYPARMLMFRARGFNLRDNFGDILKGLRTVEEIRDDAVVIDAQSPPTPTLNEPIGTKTDALAEKLKGRGNNVEPDEVKPDPADVLASLLDSLSECGDVEAVNQYVAANGKSITQLSRLSRPKYKQLDEAIKAKRDSFTQPAREPGEESESWDEPPTDGGMFSDTESAQKL